VILIYPSVKIEKVEILSDKAHRLARSLRIHVHICKGDGIDPKSIVNIAKRKSKEYGVKYDKIFCTNIHILIKRFQALKKEQNYFGQQRRSQ
jgi:hypothetical protein